MNSQQLAKLLEKYQNGQISAEELDMLNRETHRDSVIKASAADAAGIRSHRRKAASLAVVAAMLIGGVGVMLHRSGNEPSVPMMAQKTVQPATTAIDTAADEISEESKAPQPVESVAIPDTYQAPEPVAEPVVKAKKQIVVIPLDTTPAVAPVFPETQVLCNLQCDADSVLSDVIKFLQV